MQNIIKPIYDTLYQKAKLHTPIQQEIFSETLSNIRILDFSARLEYLKKQSLAEALKEEDNDILPIPELSETCPICDDLNVLEKYIQDFFFTRYIEGIGIHCTGTHIRATISGMLAHWKKLGWVNPGYHIVVHYDGSFTILADFNEVSNGVKGFNSKLINISTIGGVNDLGKIENTLSNAQFSTMSLIIKNLRKKKPSLYIKGHRDFPKVTKACPVYNAAEKYMFC